MLLGFTQLPPQDEMIPAWKLLHHSSINIDAIPWRAALAWGEKKEPKKRNSAPKRLLDTGEVG
jgi:hypothetical protein